jgi:hypothetical protein
MNPHTVDTAMARRMVEASAIRGASIIGQPGERMRRAHEAAAYDTWFRQQVQEAIDDPRPSIPHDEVMAEFAERRAALREKIAAQ